MSGWTERLKRIAGRNLPAAIAVAGLPAAAGLLLLAPPSIPTGWRLLFAGLLVAAFALGAAALHFSRRSDERTRQSETADLRLREAIEALDSPFALFDADDRLLHWNTAMLDLTPGVQDVFRRGVSLSELLRTNIERGHIPASEGREEEYFRERLAEYDRYDRQIEAYTAEGRWVVGRHRRLRGGGRVAFWSDVSDLKEKQIELEELNERLKEQQTELLRAQAELETSEFRFRNLAEASAQWFWETDADHRYVWFSENVERHTGVPPEWHYGKSRIELGAPSEPDPAWDEHLGQLERHEPFRDVTFYRSGPDGPRWVRSSGVPQFDAEGQFTGYLGSGTDITELMLAERAYEQSRDHLSKAISSISDGIALFDAEDRLILCNDNFRTSNPWADGKLEPGLPFMEMMAIFRDALPENYDDEARVRWFERRRVLRDSEDDFMEFEIQGGRWARVSDHRTADGGTVVVRTDITGLKQRQLELEIERNNAEEASRAKSDFLTNMSHELRTPLNAIIGFSDLMAGSMFGPLSDRYQGYATDIGASGRHLLSLINDLLDTAKIESGQFEISAGIVPLHEMLTQTVSLIRPSMQERAIRLSIKEEVPANAEILADPRALRQILLNLLSNAVKFSYHGGEVLLSARAESADLEIRVQDSGIGLSEGDLERVFERFTQVEDAMRRSHTGTGIGLPLSRALAEMHDGTLHLESPPGQGTTAVLRLPGSVQQALSRSAG